MHRCFLLFTLFLVSCGSFTATESKSGTVAKGWFTDLGRSGTITMKLPDGEVLKGSYSALRANEIVSQSFLTGTASSHTHGSTSFQGTAQSATGVPLATFSGTANTELLSSTTLNAYGITSTSSGHGLARGWLKSTKPGSDLFMEFAVRYGLFGGGFGVGQDNQGRIWKIFLGG